MSKLIFLVVVAIFEFVATAPTISTPGLKILTTEQFERLRTWNQGDKQDIWELSGQFEGDMVLEAGQRNGLINERYRWSNNEIPYVLAPGFDDEEIAWIKKSLEEFVDRTCLVVRERTPSDTDYVYVTGDNSGCWSYVGRRGGMQTLNLQRSYPGNGCFRNGTIVHEFLHAAGFYHQQSSPDRDDYVIIVWENIQSGTQGNFDKMSWDVVTTFGQPYDYGSVMHYGAYAFSANGERTIVTLDPEAEIGQRYEMSEIDATKVNLMYCPDKV
ncbi:discoidin cub egf laminin and zinc metalloprotease domain containing [Holotrichia oblita]|uniref:Discoidin cub egf laminin and zinc metalloprotease domain containing n=2 Tax=Holotrichia oblita TaxID=644536 RepID=A0ACB9SUF4_HOLOL|nr:discoidin cub egf laminin and zinc metalloprotease domain containing [Holotrichia oblita]KAI4457870.1 discoidin cub egf laminin and zinc metalloprotease domain containing [Holotrichia oblita]